MGIIMKPLDDMKFFEVSRQPVTLEGTDILVPRKNAITVNGTPTGHMTSEKYAIHQPKNIYRSFQRVCKKTGLEIDRKRSFLNPSNGGMILSAKYKTKMFDTGNKKERHDFNVVFYTAHDGKYKTFLTIDVLRLLCMNQAPALYRGKDNHVMSEKHYKNALKLSTLESRLEGIEQSVNMYQARMENLCDVKMTLADFKEFYIAHYKLDKESSHFDGKMETLEDVYYDAKGQSEIANDTAYKAFNVITYLNTHKVSNTNGREENKLTVKAKDTSKVLRELLAA